MDWLEDCRHYLDCWVKELLSEIWDAGCQLLGLYNLGPFLATVDAMGDQDWLTTVHAFRSEYNLQDADTICSTYVMCISRPAF